MQHGQAIARNGVALARSDAVGSACCCDVPPPCPFYYKATMCSPGACPTPYDIYVCADLACRGPDLHTPLLPTAETARAGVVRAVGVAETWRALAEPGDDLDPAVDLTYVEMESGSSLEFTLLETGLRPYGIIANDFLWRTRLLPGNPRDQWWRMTVLRHGVPVVTFEQSEHLFDFHLDFGSFVPELTAYDGLTMRLEVLAQGPVGPPSAPTEGIAFSYCCPDITGQRPFEDGDTIMATDGRCFKVATATKFCISPPPPPPDDPVEPGWTEYKLGPGAKAIYLASNGLDSNDGLARAAPKRTFNAGYAAMSPTAGDHLLFRRGDAFDTLTSYWDKWGTASFPARISSYGKGVRPVINTTGASNGLEAHNNPATIPKSNLAITDVRFATTHDGINGTPKAIYFNGRFTNITVEGIEATGYFQNVVFEGNTDVPLSNIVVRRNNISECYRLAPDGHPGGLYVDGTTGLLVEENVFDRNGYTGQAVATNPPPFIHNVYIQGHDGETNDCANVTTRWNVHSRAVSSSFQQRPGGVAEGNVGIDNPFHHTLGGVTGVPTVGRYLLNIGCHDQARHADYPDHALGVFLQVSGNVDFTLLECINTSGGAGGMRSTGNISGFSTENTVLSLAMPGCIAWDMNQSGAANNGVSMFIGGPFPTTQRPYAVGTLTINDCSFQQPRGGDLVTMYRDVQTRNFTGNHYWTVVVDPFQLPDHNRITYSVWVTATHDTSGPLALRAFPDPDRNTRTFLIAQGIDPGADADATYIAGAKTLTQKGHRDERFHPKLLNTHIRAGFGLSPIP